MEKKLQIFVSSTYIDLKAKREAVVKAILEMNHIPVALELHAVADENHDLTEFQRRTFHS